MIGVAQCLAGCRQIERYLSILRRPAHRRFERAADNADLIT
jgi:hypothetical protein